MGIRETIEVGMRFFREDRDAIPDAQKELAHQTVLRQRGDPAYSPHKEVAAVVTLSHANGDY